MCRRRRRLRLTDFRGKRKNNNSSRKRTYVRYVFYALFAAVTTIYRDDDDVQRARSGEVACRNRQIRKRVVAL